MQKQAVVYSDDSSDEKCSEAEEEEEYPGKFYRPRENFQPLNIEATTPTESTPTKLLKKARDVALDFKNSVFDPFSKFLGNKSPEPGVRRKRSSLNVDSISSSNSGDFNYFTVFEDNDDCMVLTHVNSQRHLMENLFAAQEKKKKRVMRRQSTNNIQLDLDDEFTDLDIYVMRPNSVYKPPTENDDDFHL
jgi:hypothetical protein